MLLWIFFGQKKEGRRSLYFASSVLPVIGLGVVVLFPLITMLIRYVGSVHF